MTANQSTDTTTQFDTIVEHMEFHVPCDCRLLWPSPVNKVVWQCKREARWAAIMPCCNRITFSCAKHRLSIDVSNCKVCGRWVGGTSLRWRRI
jgi:hypothetical protein